MAPRCCPCGPSLSTLPGTPPCPLAAASHRSAVDLDVRLGSLGTSLLLKNKLLAAGTLPRLLGLLEGFILNPLESMNNNLTRNKTFWSKVTSDNKYCCLFTIF